MVVFRDLQTPGRSWVLCKILISEKQLRKEEEETLCRAQDFSICAFLQNNKVAMYSSEYWRLGGGMYNPLNFFCRHSFHMRRWLSASSSYHKVI